MLKYSKETAYKMFQSTIERVNRVFFHGSSVCGSMSHNPVIEWKRFLTQIRKKEDKVRFLIEIRNAIREEEFNLMVKVKDFKEEELEILKALSAISTELKAEGSLMFTNLFQGKAYPYIEFQELEENKVEVRKYTSTSDVIETVVLNKEDVESFLERT